MICEQCQKEGKKSKIYGGNSGSATCLGFESFYDEEGNYHVHNPNITSYHYRCSNGHEFSIPSYNKCLNCGWTNEPKGEK